MKYNPIVSFRMDFVTRQKIDEYCNSHPYVKRSFVINQVLNAVFSCASQETLQNIIETFDPYSAGYELHFVSIKK